MLGRFCRYNLRNGKILIRCSSQITKHDLNNENNIVNTISKEIEEYSQKTTTSDRIEDYSLLKEAKSVLDPLDEDISHISSYLKPTFNFAAYINKSDSLQRLLKIGVDFHKIEKNAEATEYILGIKYEDIEGHILFLNNLGLLMEEIADIITRNPLLLKEDLDNLKIRINYLEYKKFTNEMIKHIIKTNAFWLTHSVQQIDEQLGFLQNYFKLNGDEVRSVAVKGSKLITTAMNKIKVNIFVVKEEMGFTEKELKKIILSRPLIFNCGEHRLLKTFEYLHRNMNIPLERIVEEPEILTCRQKRLMERHSFLVKLDKAQYDPKKPNYISLISLVSGNDSNFSTEVAKSSIQAYNAFLKSL